LKTVKYLPQVSPIHINTSSLVNLLRDVETETEVDIILQTLRNLSVPQIERFQNVMMSRGHHRIDVTTLQSIMEAYGQFAKAEANLPQENGGTEWSIDDLGGFGSEGSVFRWLESEPSYVSFLDVEGSPGAVAAPQTLHSPPAHDGLSLPSSILPGLSPEGLFLEQY
jgi:hypothetical protein